MRFQLKLAFASPRIVTPTRRIRTHCSTSATALCALPWDHNACPVLIDSPAKLSKVSTVFNSASILGLDTETKPRRVRDSARHPPELLQVAVVHDTPTQSKCPSQAYIFDLPSLLPHHAKFLDSTLAGPLADPRTLVLGVDLGYDFQELREFYPQCGAFRDVTKVVDLGLLRGDAKRWGVKRLADRFVHAKLSKRQQQSDWSRRPLSTAQLQYAANDARILLAIYLNSGGRTEFNEPRDFRI